MTLKEQAEEIGVSMSALRNWIKKNKPVVNKKGLSKWLKENDFEIAKEILRKEKAIRSKTEELKQNGLRECAKCKIEDNIKNFIKDENLCNNCYKEKMNKYYNDNKETLREKQKDYYQNHKEQHIATAQKWRDKNRIELRKRQKEYRDKNKENTKFWGIKSRFGLTKEEYNKMLEECNNQCNICFIEMNTPNIDHDHTTEKVRNLLCRDCNFAIGDLDDNIDLIKKTINYLLYSYLKYCYEYKYISSSRIHRKKDYYMSILDNPTTCEICSEISTQMHIDHDYFNKRIRGFICNYCNHAIGHFKDSVINLGNAIAYLEKYKI